jgi:Zn-finger domain-containing protein
MTQEEYEYWSSKLLQARLKHDDCISLYKSLYHQLQDTNISLEAWDRKCDEYERLEKSRFKLIEDIELKLRGYRPPNDIR